MKYSLTALNKNIYLLEFNDSYDLAMHFLRYQEYYESGCEKFRDKSFTILDYIEWQFKNEKSFIYPKMWEGFNIPGKVFIDLFENKKIKDWNKYDSFMHSVYQFIKNQTKCFYVIGCQFKDAAAMDHEICHALYYTNKKYQNEVLQKLSTLDKKIYYCLATQLIKEGYSPVVVYDEMNAYLSNELTDKMETALLKLMNVKQVKTLQNSYKKLFKTYFKQLKLQSSN